MVFLYLIYVKLLYKSQFNLKHNDVHPRTAQAHFPSMMTQRFLSLSGNGCTVSPYDLITICDSGTPFALRASQLQLHTHIEREQHSLLEGK